MDKSFKDNRVEMIKDDGWANVGWTGIVLCEDEDSAYVKWDRGKTYSHMKYNLKIISHNNPNTAFVLYKQKLRKKTQITKKIT